MMRTILKRRACIQDRMIAKAEVEEGQLRLAPGRGLDGRILRYNHDQPSATSAPFCCLLIPLIRSI